MQILTMGIGSVLGCIVTSYLLRKDWRLVYKILFWVGTVIPSLILWILLAGKVLRIK